MLFTQQLNPIANGLPADHSRKVIPSGNSGTSQTIAAMQMLVGKGKRDQRVRSLAIRLARQCPKKNYKCYAEKIYQYCRDEIQYVYDPVSVEYVEHPRKLLDAGGGDCDSVCVLLASMLEGIGLPCRYVTIKADPSQPNEFSHVFLQVGLPRKGGGLREWKGMDVTMEPPVPFGWEPPRHFPRKTWPASTDPMVEEGDADMMGIGEGPIPGVVNFDANTQGPSADYRQLDYAGGQPSGVSPTGMGDLGLVDDPTLDTIGVPDRGVISTVYAVADGSMYKNLVKAQQNYEKMRKELAQRRIDIAKMPKGDNRVEAEGLWANARSNLDTMLKNLNEAMEKYNSVAQAVAIATADTVNPQRFRNLPYTGLGALPALPVAAIIAASGLALFALASVIDSIQGNEASSRGYLDQLANVIQQSGVAIDKGTGFVRTAMWAALAAGAAYIAYDLYSGAHRRPTAALARTQPKTTSIKTVKGRVL